MEKRTIRCALELALVLLGGTTVGCGNCNGDDGSDGGDGTVMLSTKGWIYYGLGSAPDQHMDVEGDTITTFKNAADRIEITSLSSEGDFLAGYSVPFSATVKGIKVIDGVAYIIAEEGGIGFVCAIEGGATKWCIPLGGIPKDFDQDAKGNLVIVGSITTWIKEGYEVVMAVVSPSDPSYKTPTDCYIAFVSRDGKLLEEQTCADGFVKSLYRVLVLDGKMLLYGTTDTDSLFFLSWNGTEGGFVRELHPPSPSTPCGMAVLPDGSINLAYNTPNGMGLTVLDSEGDPHSSTFYSTEQGIFQANDLAADFQGRPLAAGAVGKTPAILWDGGAYFYTFESGATFTSVKTPGGRAVLAGVTEKRSFVMQLNGDLTSNVIPSEKVAASSSPAQVSVTDAADKFMLKTIYP